jgi:hypothetical protein
MWVTPCGNIGNCTCGIHYRCQNRSKKSRLLALKTSKNGSSGFLAARDFTGMDQEL